MKSFVIFFALVMNLVLADAVTKEIAEHLLVSGDSFQVIPGFFDFALVHNRGCAWGLLQGQVWPLAVFGLLAQIVLVWRRGSVFRETQDFRILRFSALKIAEVLIHAGIAGNVIDRLCRGYVIDMFDFHWKNAWHYPCFNLADVYICTAAGLLILSGFRNTSESCASESESHHEEI